MPDLIIDHEVSHEEYEKNILLLVDNKGAIIKIYEDPKKSKEVPFSNKSKVAKKMQCQGEVVEVTKE